MVFSKITSSQRLPIAFRNSSSFWTFTGSAAAVTASSHAASSSAGQSFKFFFILSFILSVVNFPFAGKIKHHFPAIIF